MGYHQLTRGERYTIARMRSRGHSRREIANCLGRSAATISRELWRNRSVHDGHYRVDKAHSKAMARRSRSRKKSQFSVADWTRVVDKLRSYWSPQQIAGRRRLHKRKPISHETIYRYVRHNRAQGGDLWRSCRHMSKIGRKHRGSPATRGLLAGKSHISERPSEVDLRQEIGHYEGDTVMGPDGRHCILTLVERVTGYVLIQKLSARNAEQAASALARMVIQLSGRIKTITLDNGTEFHGYKSVQDRFGVKFFFATPYHSWERGTNENTNGLIRQYLPKGMCLKALTQAQCNWIANELNNRPRERLGFRTPAEAFRRPRGVALQS
ncbi:MAG: IS30 family transposase [Planctomycetes bacterium]|nr:IS30 family transposase [Planctomycetota bacterium]